MNDILKSDIFFIVTTIAVVVVSVFAVIVLFRIIRILRNINKVSSLAGDGADAIREDMSVVREHIHTGAKTAKGEVSKAFADGGIVGVITLLLGYAYRGTPKRKKSPLRKK